VPKTSENTIAITSYSLDHTEMLKGLYGRRGCHSKSRWYDIMVKVQVWITYSKSLTITLTIYLRKCPWRRRENIRFNC